MHDQIKNVTYFFLAISLCNIAFLSLSCTYVFGKVRKFLSTETENWRSLVIILSRINIFEKKHFLSFRQWIIYQILIT